MKKTIFLTEVGLRDGLQLIKTRLPTKIKQTWLKKQIEAGFHEVEISSIVPKKILQIGSSDGYTLSVFKKNGAQMVSGIEPTVSSCEFAKEKYQIDCVNSSIENYELFPEKTNVTFAQIKDSSNILVNVWERGAGLTKACGTAACATGVVAFEKKLSGNDTNIHFKEGLLNIKYNGEISMTGPVSNIKQIKIKL